MAIDCSLLVSPKTLHYEREKVLIGFNPTTRVNIITLALIHQYSPIVVQSNVWHVATVLIWSLRGNCLYIRLIKVYYKVLYEIYATQKLLLNVPRNALLIVTNLSSFVRLIVFRWHHSRFWFPKSWMFCSVFDQPIKYLCSESLCGDSGTTQYCPI